MEQFSEEDWKEIEEEIAQALLSPKITQLDSITILKILEMIPEGEIWLVCLGRFRVKWQNRENFYCWWSPKVIWWIGKI